MNLLGTLGNQMTRDISAGVSLMSPSDKYISYDRTNGNVTLILPLMSDYIDSIFKSGNSIYYSVTLSDVTPSASSNTFTILCNSSDNIGGASSVSYNSLYDSFNLNPTPSGWLLLNKSAVQAPQSLQTTTEVGNTTSIGIVLTSELPSTIASINIDGKIIGLDTTDYPSLPELTFVKGLTSSAQSQINSKFSTAIVRYVYLVADASDATRMGGTSANVYTTFQTAYDAANTLQVALGGNNIVVLRVGNTIANQSNTTVTSLVGDLTLTANFNYRVRIIGDSPIISVLGSIIANNASGNGYSLSGTGTNVLSFSNISVNNITTNATGITGNSGAVYISSLNCYYTSINTSITNVLNITGNGGDVTLQNILGIREGLLVGAITTSSRATTTSSGAVSITNGNTKITSITTSNGNLNGHIVISGENNTVNTINVNSVNGILVNISNTTCNGAININGVGGYVNMRDVRTNGELNISGLSYGLFEQCRNVSIVSELLIPLTIIKCICFNISNLGDDSKIVQSTIGDVQTIVFEAITEIGTNVKILQSYVYATSAITNSVPVTVTGTGSIFETITDLNVTII